jgi:Transposase DDE domain
MHVAYDIHLEEATMKAPKSKQRAPAPRQSLKQSLQEFLTPTLWKQAQHCRQVGQRRKSSRWATQPLVLVLLFMTWTCGDSQAERFVTARAFCQVCLPKRRRPGKTVQGYQKALARLPMNVLRTLAAGVRQLWPTRLAGWLVDGFVPLGCDGSRLACPRAESLEQHLGQAGKDGSAPTLWVTALVHLRLGVPWAWRFGKGTASERSHLEHLVRVLPAAALLVADAGYFGYALTQFLLSQRVEFLLRMSSNVTLYTEQDTPLSGYREGVVYYWPAQKAEKQGARPLRLRLLRLRGRRRKHDVWLLTNVLEPARLSRKLAGQMYRWRWENEGCFRTYKHTLRKVKLVSRTVRLVHREAEGSWLALQLLIAQGALAQAAPATGAAPACSPRQILLTFRQELLGLVKRGQPRYWEQLQRAQREQRARRTTKERRVWPRRKPHEAPQPPKLLKLTEQQRAYISGLKCEAA